MSKWNSIQFYFYYILLTTTSSLSFSPDGFHDFHFDLSKRNLRPTYQSPSTFSQRRKAYLPLPATTTHKRKSQIERANPLLSSIQSENDISLVQLMNEYQKSRRGGSTRFPSNHDRFSSTNKFVNFGTYEPQQYNSHVGPQSPYTHHSPGYNRWGKQYIINNSNLEKQPNTIVYQQTLGAQLGEPQQDGNFATVSKIDRFDINSDQNSYENSLRTNLEIQPPYESENGGRSPRLFSQLFKWLKLLKLSGKKECTTLDKTIGECKSTNQCRMEHGSIETGNTKCGTGVCCVALINKCGLTTNKNLTVFTPPAQQTMGMIFGGGKCYLRINKSSKDISHLRLDFRRFELKPPVNGTCIEDRMTVTGQNFNSIIPQLCGVATGQHLYVEVGEATGPIELNIMTISNAFTRKWKIQVSQIKRSSITKPPQNCLQYHTGTTGTIESFNYIQQTGQYQNNQNYAICLRKESGYCTIQYSVPNGKNFTLPNFRTGNVTVAAGNAGVGLIDCPDDYIVIASTRLCGDRFNDGSLPAMTENAIIKDTTNGPFILQFASNLDSIGEGFHLAYQQLPCS